jgi:hypothetical protein
MHARDMTSELSPAKPGISAEVASTAAVISSVGAGLAWAVLAYRSLDMAASRTDSTLGSVGALLGVGLPGIVGIGVLLIPLAIGLVSRSVQTRLAAAWVEAVVCGLAAVLWFTNVVTDDATGTERLLASLAAVALLVPLVITAAATWLAAASKPGTTTRSR